MNLINELRMLAEDLHVNGYNRYSAAMSKAAGELDKWEAVFGHLGGTPDECGNAIVAARDELEERTRRLESALHRISLCSQNSTSSQRERDALRAKIEKVEAALRIAVRQNSHDMLMTGDELRQCEAALEEST